MSKILSGLADMQLSMGTLMQDANGKPLSLPVNRIDFDPENVRSKSDPEALAELAATIKSQGLLQPISVRPHPTKKNFYIVNMGERRLRAVRLLGQDTIDAYIRTRFDPYAQAIENLHREDLSPMDLARFVVARENEGDNRATIARKLGKSASFITEAAQLASAPKYVIDAFNAGRIPDTRTAYLLAKASNTNPDAVRGLIRGDSPLTREGVASALGEPVLPAKTAATEKKVAGGKAKPVSAKVWKALSVVVGSRAGVMGLRGAKNRASAVVRFADGSEETVELNRIKLTKWTDNL